MCKLGKWVPFCLYQLKRRTDTIYLLCLLCFGFIVFSIAWSVTTKHSNHKITPIAEKLTKVTKPTKLKYVLRWTSLPNIQPFGVLLEGQSAFKKRRCPLQNCYITSNMTLLDNVTKFDAILFHGPNIPIINMGQPKYRAPEQLYIFVSQESSHHYPVCKTMYNNFFNWTWTYRLDSDISFAYLAIKDKKGKTVGPSRQMHWIPNGDMMRTPLSSNTLAILEKKTKAVAWFVSNCEPRSNRSHYVNKLKDELKKYNLTVDIYGRCGTLKCGSGCNKMVKDDYHFYLAFENSYCEDYVTEKFLTAVQNYAIPVVLGTANYSRFMPDPFYLNAIKIEPKEMARKMDDIIQHKEKFFKYFHWLNFYSYHDYDELGDFNRYCGLCADLNNVSKTSKPKVYKNMTEWWNQGKVKC